MYSDAQYAGVAFMTCSGNEMPSSLKQKWLKKKKKDAYFCENKNEIVLNANDFLNLFTPTLHTEMAF